MSDALLDLLRPHLGEQGPSLSANDPTTAKYLTRLTTLSLDALKTTEPQSIAQSAHSTLLSLQALANRSHRAFIASADHLSTLQNSLPGLSREVQKLQDAIPRLDDETVRFSTTYSRTGENPILERRKKAMQLLRNVDRISDVLELPALLATAVSSTSSPAQGAGGGTSAVSTTSSYSSALDLYSHIKRLHALYPDSPLVRDIVAQAEAAMKDMTTNLIAALRTQNIRLAAAMRTVGWLRRVAPELEHPRSSSSTSSPSTSEGAFGALFLICRLANLVSMLEALDPLRELADQETQRRLAASNSTSGQQESLSASNKWSDGHQTERFLKRYIEIYREQSFAIVSLYKNIFAPDHPGDGFVPGLEGFRTQTHLSTTTSSKPAARNTNNDPLQALPPAIATFPMHLARLLTDTLRTYLPNVRDRSARESLLTQVLYCAASLGRLGGDFGMILTELEGMDDDTGSEPREWEQIMAKHRALAGRLEQLTSSTTGGKGGSSETPSPQ
ncbi:hypothetical protein VTN49DRAFT_6758 [Thermomyces lanuginosus]|uniref:uncharacterized protein n=1 Tax=Thermomyces lanuginosus TaxID=5541 RepID=UPI003742F9A9